MLFYHSIVNLLRAFASAKSLEELLNITVRGKLMA